MRFLIVGLGNPGAEYERTRHNVGFTVLDKLADRFNVSWSVDRYADRTEFRAKGRTYILIKPQTYMNLSGKAVRYWLQTEKLEIDRLLVVADDLALPFGRMRIRAKGGAGGHNGLQSIIDTLGGANWARLRFGIGRDFHQGQQTHYVLGTWSEEEGAKLEELVERATEGIVQFGTIGVSRAMNQFNN
jgi:PTH1 family peptidyl-tRNA hydrolase